MNTQEFLNNVKKLIKGSLHEGYLTTEINSAADIIEKYNESMHILDIQYIPVFEDKRYFEIIDRHQVNHGSIFIDKDQFNFMFYMDNYDLHITIDRLCPYYRKTIKSNTYMEIFEDEQDLIKNLPAQYIITNENGTFLNTKRVFINQHLNNNENAITASFVNYEPSKEDFITTNFEYNTIGLGPRAMSIDNSSKNYVTRYTSYTVKTPNNDVKCVDNKAYGYMLMFGLEKYIKNLAEHNIKALKCQDLSFYDTVRFKPTPVQETIEIKSFFDQAEK